MYKNINVILYIHALFGSTFLNVNSDKENSFIILSLRKIVSLVCEISSIKNILKF